MFFVLTCKVSAKDAANEGEGEDDKKTNARDRHHRTKGDRPVKEIMSSAIFLGASCFTFANGSPREIKRKIFGGQSQKIIYLEA